MTKWRSGGGTVLLVFLLGLALLASKSWATSYTFNYPDVTWDFTLTGFSDEALPPNGTIGPDILDLTNITGLTLPNPPGGLYNWSATIEALTLDLVPGNADDFINTFIAGLLPRTLPVGTYEAPLAASGITPLPGGLLNFEWHFYSDLAGSTPANPGDPIRRARLLLYDNTGGTILQPLNDILANMEYIWESTHGAPPYNLNNIDGSGTASFQITASVIPEPGTMCLTGLGLLGLGALGARRKKRAR